MLRRKLNAGVPSARVCVCTFSSAACNRRAGAAGSVRRAGSVSASSLSDDLPLETAIADHHVSDRIAASIDLRPLPAGLALAALCAIYGVIPIAQALRMRQHSTM